MIKEVKELRVLIAYSGLQPNGFILTEEAIRKIQEDKNEGKPVINRIDSMGDRICGYLSKTELIQNIEANRLELWGFIHVYDVEEYLIEQDCSYSYEISCMSEDIDETNTIHKAKLLGGCMVKGEN